MNPNNPPCLNKPKLHPTVANYVRGQTRAQSSPTTAAAAAQSNTCAAGLLPGPAAVGLARPRAGAQELEARVAGEVNLMLHQILGAKLLPVRGGLQGRAGGCKSTTGKGSVFRWVLWGSTTLSFLSPTLPGPWFTQFLQHLLFNCYFPRILVC